MLQIGLIGFGNVGQGVADIIHNNQTLLQDRTGQTINIKYIGVRNTEKYAHHDIGSAKLTTDIDQIINDPEIQIIVEVVGGEYPMYDYICQALKNKKYVVTANKEVMAKHKNEFFKLAKENNVDIYFEAAVAGGIPIIRSLKVGFAANKIESLYGILNGTTNYILTKIQQNQAEFDTVLKESQELGLAEADPTMDVSGLDAAYKLVILAAVAFKVDIQLENITYQGIECISLRDIQYAEEFGYTIKLLAIGKRHDKSMSFSVQPTMIHQEHPLANIHNELNAVYIYGNAVGEALLSGKGAGGSPTGSAVISDIIDIAFDLKQSQSQRNLETSLQSTALTSPNELKGQHYFRLKVADHPHALEKITGAFSHEDVNIAKIIQKDTTNNKAEIVLITYPANQLQIHNIEKSLAKIDKSVTIETSIPVGIDV